MKWEEVPLLIKPNKLYMKTTCLIIDDEKLARELIVEYLQAHPELELLGECSKGTEAVEK